MAGDARERIMNASLELFSQNGYLGTSMSDIAESLGVTKAALYKHYSGKREILKQIVDHMVQLDYERALEYDMPETEPDGFAEKYMKTPLERIREYAIAQFRHWTEDGFSSRFRRMLVLEQYRDAEMGRLFQQCLASGPVEYMAAIFRRMTASGEEAMGLALEFYGPMFLLYSVYDGAEDKQEVLAMLERHIDGFIVRAEKRRSEAG